MFKKDESYTQVYLEGLKCNITRWVPTEDAKVGKKIGPYKVIEIYAEYPKEFVLKFPKDFKTLDVTN